VPKRGFGIRNKTFPKGIKSKRGGTKRGKKKTLPLQNGGVKREKKGWGFGLKKGGEQKVLGPETRIVDQIISHFALGARVDWKERKKRGSKPRKTCWALRQGTRKKACEKPSIRTRKRNNPAFRCDKIAGSVCEI